MSHGGADGHHLAARSTGFGPSLALIDSRGCSEGMPLPRVKRAPVSPPLFSHACDDYEMLPDEDTPCTCQVLLCMKVFTG